MRKACINMFSGVALTITAVFITPIAERAQAEGEIRTNGCPEISVTGTAGVSVPGEMIRFVAVIEPKPEAEIKFHWFTSTGRVDQGQSTNKIEVLYTPDLRGTSLTATVRISGLPPGCPDTATEWTPLEWQPVPEVISEFTVPVTAIDQKRLGAAAGVLNRHPNNQMYIIEYLPPGTSAALRKIKKETITAFLSRELKFDSSRISFVFANSPRRPRTVIYNIPPGASNPIP